MKTAPSVPIPKSIEADSQTVNARDIPEQRFQRHEKAIANSEHGDMVLSAIEIGFDSRSFHEKGAEIIALHKQVIDDEAGVPFMYSRGVKKYFRIRRKSGHWLYRFSTRE